MPSSRVSLLAQNVGNVGNTEFTVDVFTGGSAAPLATLADNNGFPAVREVYARQLQVPGDLGALVWVIRLTVRFFDPISPAAQELAVNLFQEDAHAFRFPAF